MRKPPRQWNAHRWQRQWLAYEKSVRDLGKETMDTITEIILDTDHSGHDCTLERL